MKTSTLYRSFLLTIGLLLIVVVSFGANRFSIANNGNWNATSTWSATSGGASGASVPVAGDAVIIEGGHNVIVNVNAACATITFTSTNNATSLTISGTNTLTVSGLITIPRTSNNNSGTNLIAVGAGILNAGSIAFTNGGGSMRHEITISTGTVTVTGDVTQNGSTGSATISFSGPGLLKLGGAFLTSGNGNLIPSNGTVEYYNGIQTVGAFTYNNLTLSGSGQKTLTGVSINGKLSMEGSATIIGSPIYTVGATLQYNSTSACTVGPEWTTPLNTPSIVTIVNTGLVTLNSDRVLNGALTINSVSSIALSSSLLSTLTVSGNITNNGSLNGGTGTLRIGGSLSGPGLFTAGTSTVDYYNAAQTVGNFVYNNLTLSGSGIKTIVGVTVNGILSMAGTATASAAPTYGAAATLQYNTTTGRNAAVEWITPFAASGGVIITSTGAINLNSAKVFNVNIPLTITSSATLNTSASNYPLTFGGDFINNGGTLSAGSSIIEITGDASNQNIGGLTTSGAVLMTKTAGTATFTGNVNGGGLTMNGMGGTLNLGTSLTHTFSGTLSRNNGTLNGGSSTLKLGSSVSGNGGTFSAGTGTVEWYASGAQNCAGYTYYNLTLSGSGLKTTDGVTVLGTLAMAGTATASSAPAFGPSASLQYQSTTPCSPGVEWITPFETSGGVIISTTGLITLNAPKELKGSASLTINTGASLAMSTFPLTINGNLVNNGSLIGGSNNLRIGGSVSGLSGFTTGTGIVEYYGDIQTVGKYTYNNLTLSGTGLKTTTGIKVNGTLSIEGTASASTAPTYGPSATLQYNTSSAQTSGPEWTTPFTTTNGVIIKNTSTISLNSDKILYGALTINNGTSLSLYASLTVSGNITNLGTLNGSSGTLRIGGSLSGTGTFTAGTSTVEYYGGIQTVGNFIYNYLILSGGAGKTINNGTAVISNLLIKGTGTKAILSNRLNMSVGSLTFEITNKTYGTWGSSISTATYKDDTYFSNSANGIVTVKQPSALNVTIIAGGGGDVCLGSTTTLTYTGTNVMNQYWQGPNGFFSTEKTPQLTNVTPAMSGTYTVTGNTVSGVNLITNGNFENGYEGITSGYNKMTTDLYLEDTYAVLAHPSDKHSNFCSCGDHTTGSGNQMVINGATMPGISVWEQTITVIPNTNYQYSYWVQSVHEGSPARIQLTINKALIGPPNPATLQTGNWTNIIYNWNSGTTTTAIIGLINQNLDANGNDFALDDIVFQEVSSAVSNVTVTVNPLSVGGNLVGNSTICSGTSPNTDLVLTGNIGNVIKWQKANDASFTNPIDISVTSTTLTGANIGNLSTTTYFRVLIQSGACSQAFSSSAVITVTPIPTATISYPGSPFCNSLASGQPVTLTGTNAYTGGTFSSTPNGLTLDPATGAITPGSSSAGTYTVTYTITTPCGNLAPLVTTSVKITTLPVTTFSYRGTPLPTFLNGGVAGTFSSTPGGLNFVSASTGEVNLTTSAQGTYSVTNTIAASGGCGIVTTTSPITITSYHTVAFIWTGTVSTDWNDFNNWLPSLVPDLTSDVVIPDADTTPFDPILPLEPAATVRTLFIATNGIMNGGTATTLTVGGSTYAWQNSGVFNPGTSTVKFTNANAGISGTTGFYNVMISSGASLTPQTGNLMQVAGALTLKGTGILNANTNANTIEYNGTDQSVINPNGTLPGYNYLILSGSGTKTFPSTQLTITKDCSLTGTATANINGATTVGGNLSIASGTITNISPTVSLTVSGTITNSNGTTGLVLKSDATGTASLINNTNSVPATVQRYIPGAAEAWHFISSPVSNQSISGTWLPSGTYNNANGWDLYLWNEPSSCWIYKLNTTTPINWNTVHPGSNFEVGRGYLYSLQAANPTNTFGGTLNNGPVTIPLTFNSIDITQRGFNLIGNPYPSAIDWQATSGWTRSILTNSGGGYDMWIWNPAAGNYGVFNSFTGYSTNSVTRYISSAQGFFVLASTSGNLQMDNNVRVNDHTTLFKNAKIYQGKLNVVVKSASDNSSDEVMLLFGNKTNNSGSRKLFSNVSTAPSLYLPSSADKFTVRYLTDTTANPFVPVMFKAGQDGNYMLETNFDFNAFQTVTLEDRKMHLFQNLKTDNTYRFQALKTDDPNRFAVYFEKTKINAPQKLSARVFTNGYNLVADLTQVNKETIVKVYDLMGRLVLQNRLPASSQTNLNINPKKQIILVYLLNSDGSYFSKVLW